MTDRKLKIIKKSPLLSKLTKIAKDKGGECLSTNWARKRLKFKCSQGHLWEAWPYNIAKGSWCPKCAIPIRASKFRTNIIVFENHAKKK